MRPLIRAVLLALAIVLVAAPTPVQQKRPPEPLPAVEKLLDKAIGESGTAQRATLRESITLARKLKDVMGEGIAQLLLAQNFFASQDFDEANVAFGAADVCFKKVPFADGLATTHNAWGTMLFALTEFRDAVDHFDRAVKYAEEAKDDEMLGLSAGGLGFSKATMGDHLGAIPAYRKGIEAFRRAKREQETAAGLNNLALSLATTGQRREAIRCLDEALPMAEKLQNPDLLAKTYNNLGLVYEMLGDFERAMEWFNKSLKLARDTKSEGLEATILSNIALYEGIQGNLKESIEHNAKAIAIMERLGEITLLPTLYNNTGLSQLSLADYDGARANFTKALAMHRKNGDQQGEGITLMNLGTLELLSQRFDEARGYFEQSLALCRVSGNAPAEANALTLIANTYDEASPETAIAIMKVAVNKLQALRHDVADLEKGTKEAYRRTLEGAYQRLADMLVRRGRLAEAQQVLDLLKVDELSQFAASRAGQDASQATLSGGEADWQKRYEEIADNVGELATRYRQALAKVRGDSASEADKAEVKKLESDLEVLRKRFAGFLHEATSELAKSAGGRAAVEDVKNTTALKQTLRKLEEQTGTPYVALYTVTSEERLHIIIITPELQDVVTMPIKAADLRAKVFAFRNLVQHEELDPRPLGKELYDLLIGPVEKKLGAKATHWLWSLDGSLRYLPLNALWDGTHYAVETKTHSVITPAGQSDLVAAPEPWKALAFGASSAQDWSLTPEGKKTAFPALPGVPNELAEISKAIPTDTYLDDKFTKDAFFDELSIRSGER